ncbi:MAG: YidC/Oxa1 family membrane protein insertase [Halanaerobiales bacterium]|nr:YidC/Oxa1 family membrane protein insertase [Halanaerobiales bacterium]
MAEALKILFTLTSNWGVAIILFTLIVKLALHPLNKKQMNSMKVMQELQPEIENLKKKYKGDKQQVQVKMMELYKEKGYNPAAGCLPLLVQLPILWALFGSIRGLAELEHAKFLWLDSLSKTGDLTLIILTAIVTFGQSYLQQKLTPNSSNQNAMMLYMMPIMIIFIGRTLPAGLLLYWFTSTLVMTVQQFLMYREPGLKGDAK